MENVQKKTIMLGAGGHAKVLLALLNLCGKPVYGVMDPHEEVGTTVMGVPVLGGDNYLEKYNPDEVDLVNGIGAFPGKDLRWKLGQTFREKGYRFLTLVHPQAIVSEGVVLAEGVQVMAGCILQPGVQVGEDSIVNTGGILDHDCVIGKHCHIAPGCTVSGGVELGKSVHLGTGSSVVHRISIGEGAIVAAGSVIFSDISPFVKVVQKKKYNLCRVNN